MMSMKGDGKPVSFIEDCAVPLEHLADYTDRLTRVFEKHGTRGTWYAHASVGTLHVRPVLNMKADGAKKMRAIAEEACAIVREYKGAAFSGEHGDGLVRSEWIEPIVGPRLARALAEIKDLFDPKGLMNPGKIVRPTKMDDRSLFRFKPGYETPRLDTALDWSEWSVPGAASQGLRRRGRDVQQQRPLPQVRRRHDVPVLSRHRRRAAPHPRPREHAAARAVGAARAGFAGVRRALRDARALRRLQGLQARMPDRRRHGADEDRVPAPLPRPPRLGTEGPADRVPPALRADRRPRRAARQPARPRAAARAAERDADRPVGEAQPAEVAGPAVPAIGRGALPGARAGGLRRRAARRHLQQLLRAGERGRGAARARGGRLPRARRARGGRGPAALLRPHVPRGRHGERGAARGAAAARRARCRMPRAACRSSASSRPAC